MADINRNMFPNMLAAKKAVRHIFLDEYKEYPEFYSEVFNTESSDSAFEEDYMAAGFPLPVKIDELEPITYDNPKSVGQVRYNHVRFALGFRVSRDFIEDEKWGFVSRLPKALARVMRYRPEVEAAAVFNNGFSAFAAGNWGTIPIGSGNTQYPMSYTAAGVTFDGKSIFHATHDLKSGGQYSNLSTTDLSFTGLQNILENFELMVDESGLLIQLRPAKVIIHPRLRMRCTELLASEFKPGTANNDINALRKDMPLMPFVWPFLTSNTRWFVTAEKKWTWLRFYWRKRTLFEQADDFDTKAVKNSAEQKFSCGASHWVGLYGNNP